MAKALKPLVIVLLVLCIASLSLGIMLFLKREVLKGRVQRTENGLESVARNLHHEEFNKAQLAAVDKIGLDNMQAPLNKLAAAAGNLYTEHEQTKAELAQTKDELAQTREELAATKTQLEQARLQITQLTDQLAQKEAELAQARSEIDQLKQEKAGLETQIAQLNTEIKTRDDKIADMTDRITGLNQEVQELQAIVYGPDAIKLGFVPKGLTGRILVVNQDWNFVVLNIGSNDRLVSGAPMLIYRDDKLVGKVLVTACTKTLSIAEVQKDWTQSPVQEGDFVVY
jgi:peptidoglycan hydrolase CwlO-like protein